MRKTVESCRLGEYVTLSCGCLAKVLYTFGKRNNRYALRILRSCEFFSLCVAWRRNGMDHPWIGRAYVVTEADPLISELTDAFNE